MNSDINPETLVLVRDKKTLYVDVTQTWGTVWQTGIQRVVRQLVASWHSSNTNIALVIFQNGEYKVLPKSALARFTVLHSARIPRNQSYRISLFHYALPYYLKIKNRLPLWIVKMLIGNPASKILRKFLRNSWVPKDSIVLDSKGAKILLLDLVFDPKQISYLKEIELKSGADITYLSYDCNPLIAPQYWPKSVSEVFPNYISLVKYSKRVWSISRTAQEDIKKYSGADLEQVVFDFKWLPPFDFPDCSHQGSLVPGLEEKKYILMVASYVPSKNHLGFLEALKELGDQGISIPKVYFVGGGSWIGPEIESKISELSILGIQVGKYEAVDDCCLGKFYQNCSFTILPSFIEGFGLPIVESLSFGKPVVTSTSTSMGELLVLPGTIGFSHDRSPNLKSILEKMISGNELLEMLTAEAITNRNNLGTWREYAEELYDFAMTERA